MKKFLIKNKKELILSLIIFAVISTPLIISFTNGQGLARFNQVSVLSNQQSIIQTIQLIITNYLQQLTPNYLFIQGEPTFITRHFTQGLYPVLGATLPLLLIAIFTLAKNRHKQWSQLLIFWIFLYPIGGAVTSSGPFTSRAIIGAPLFSILTGLGIYTLLQYVMKYLPIKFLTLIRGLIILILTINLFFYLQFYFVKYPLYSADFWGW